MDVKLTEAEIDEVDQMMNDHMYHHTISNSYHNFTCNPGCRVQALGRAINKVLQEKPSPHRLDVVVVKGPTFATYMCECGQSGTATMASHLGSLAEIESRAVKNHELHQVRALRKSRTNLGQMKGKTA